MLMTTIHSDAEFKAALSRLPLDQQRRVGKLFVENVIDLSDNPKVEQAINIADKADLSAAEIAEGFKIARVAAIDSYTLCGRDADWLGQASHFVASAAAMCLTPEDQVAQCGDLAWSTAMNARMAKVCETIAHGQGADDQEAERQYAILETFQEPVRE
jgi:hypothetical protein